jgi:hypothetical protein
MPGTTDDMITRAGGPDAMPTDLDSTRPPPANRAYAAAKHHVLQFGPECDPAGMPLGFGPDALCIGAQKGATTWLYTNLAFHPLIWLPPIKELNFFTSVHVRGHGADDASHRRRQIKASRTWWEEVIDRDEERRQRLALLDHLADEQLTNDWYTGIFDFRGPDHVAIDISPEYCLLPRDGIRHALAINPNLKVIALLRDPVERALSHAAMLAGEAADEAAMWEILRSEATVVLTKYSDYPRWLNRWRGLLPAGRLFVATMRQVRAEPLAVLDRLCGFLGLPFHADLFPEAATPVFAGSRRELTTPEMRDFLRERMDRIYQDLAAQWPDLAADFASP